MVSHTRCKAPFTQYNLLSNRLYRVYKHSTGLTTGCIVYTAGCQTGCTSRYDNRLNEQWLFVQHDCQTGCQTGLTTGLTTGWMFVYTIQPVVKPVVQPVWQPAVSCKRGIKVAVSGNGTRKRRCWYKRCWCRLIGSHIWSTELPNFRWLCVPSRSSYLVPPENHRRP